MTDRSLLEISMGKVRDDDEEIPSDPRLILEVMSKEPDFLKYTFRSKDEKNKPKDTIETMKKMLSSPIFGGSVFSKRIDGHRNSLKK